MHEIWKDVTDYDIHYRVSNLGRVAGGARNRIKKTYIDKQGYEFTGVIKDGKPTVAKVHRLVAKAFILNPNNKPAVNHINSIRCDNRVENLEWCTESENIRHAVLFGNFLTNERGRGGAKLTPDQVEEIKKLLNIGSKPVEVARQYNISNSNIYHIRSGYSWGAAGNRSKILRSEIYTENV